MSDAGAYSCQINREDLIEKIFNLKVLGEPLLTTAKFNNLSGEFKRFISALFRDKSLTNDLSSFYQFHCHLPHTFMHFCKLLILNRRWGANRSIDKFMPAQLSALTGGAIDNLFRGSLFQRSAARTAETGRRRPRSQRSLTEPVDHGKPWKTSYRPN